MGSDSDIIRPSQPGDDVEAIEKLYREAFPEEDLLPLVRTLLMEHEGILSLVAIRRNQLVGHIVFTRCSTSGAINDCALLAPLGVLPAYQKQGVGRRLIQEGHARLRLDNITRVFVLGDPAYYGRFGYLPERAVLPAYPIPAEWADAWQSHKLADEPHAHQGPLHLPALWMRPELWTP